MASKFESEADRDGFRQIVEDKLRELRIAAEKDGEDDFSPSHPDYAAQAILVSGLIGCCNADAIAEGLGFDPDFVHQIVARLRANYLWSDKEYEASKELAEGDSGIVFSLHTLVANGEMQRFEDGRYSMTDSGKRRVERLLRK